VGRGGVALFKEFSRFLKLRLRHADLAESSEGVVIIEEQFERTAGERFRLVQIAGDEVEVRPLREQPGAVFEFLVRRGIVGHLHQLESAGEVAVQFAQIGGTGEASHAAGTKIEHPLSGSDGIRVSQLGIGVGEIAVDGDVIGRGLVQILGDDQGFGEFVTAEEKPRFHFEAFVVVRRNGKGALEGLFGLAVPGDIGGFAGAAGVGHG